MATEKETCLSPGVRRLITEVGVHDGDGVTCITDAGLIDWDKTEEILPNVSTTNDEEYFEACVRLLAPLLRNSEFRFGKLTTKHKFEETYLPLLTWTGAEKIVQSCFDLLRVCEGDGTDVLLSMLLLTSVLERALGDVYLLKASSCPSMLKDLLVTRQLGDLLGTPVIQILRIVMGPSTSLNLRNIAWHGFPVPGEIPVRYSWFLLLLIPSIGEILRNKNITEIPHRLPVEFPMIPVYQNRVTGISPTVVLQIIQLLEHTDIVKADRRPVWKSALKQYTDQRFGLCATLMLPQLEHMLRRIFSSVNNCPHRILTAEATTLFTTFDEILNPFLENGEENKLAAEIGESNMNMLMDVLVYPAGPRVRDRLSHGEVDLCTFPQVLCDVLLTIVVYLAARYVPADILSNLQCTETLDILKLGQEYHSLFHPISQVKQKIEALVSSAAELNKCIHYTYQLEDRCTYDYQEMCREAPLVDAQTQIHDIVVRIIGTWKGATLSLDHVLTRFLEPVINGKQFMDDILAKEIKTLYRFHKPREKLDLAVGQNTEGKESEVVNLLYRILTECQTVLCQVQTTVQTKQNQYQQGELSTRQTDSLHKLIMSCPSFHLMIHLISLVVAWQLYNMDTYCNGQRSRVTIRFLKTLLQHCENMRTYTGPNKQRWTECVDMSVVFLNKLKIFAEQPCFQN